MTVLIQQQTVVYQSRNLDNISQYHLSTSHHTCLEVLWMQIYQQCRIKVLVRSPFFWDAEKQRNPKKTFLSQSRCEHFTSGRILPMEPSVENYSSLGLLPDICRGGECSATNYLGYQRSPGLFNRRVYISIHSPGWRWLGWLYNLRGACW